MAANGQFVSPTRPWLPFTATDPGAFRNIAFSRTSVLTKSDCTGRTNGRTEGESTVRTTHPPGPTRRAGQMLPAASRRFSFEKTGNTGKNGKKFPFFPRIEPGNGKHTDFFGKRMRPFSKNIAHFHARHADLFGKRSHPFSCIEPYFPQKGYETGKKQVRVPVFIHPDAPGKRCVLTKWQAPSTGNGPGKATFPPLLPSTFYASSTAGSVRCAAGP